jgi:hypothetical protein
MTPISKWSIKRAGGAMTITHAGGKVTNIEVVEPRIVDGVLHIVAVQEGGALFSLQPEAVQ